MARSTREIFCVLVAALQVGCITGQAFDAARLDEGPEELVEACRQGDWIRVRYQAVSTREFGQVVSRHERAAAIRLSDLEARPRLPVDRVEVLALEPGEVKSGPDCLAIPATLVAPGNPSDDGGEDKVIVPRGVLHRDRTAAWVYPLVPLTLALDAAATPVLLVFWAPYVAASD